MSHAQQLRENTDRLKAFLFDHEGPVHPQHISLALSHCTMLLQSANRLSQLTPEKRANDLQTAGVSEEEVWQCCDELRDMVSGKEKEPQPANPEPVKEQPQPVQAQQPRRNNAPKPQNQQRDNTRRQAEPVTVESSPVSVDFDKWRSLLMPLVSSLLAVVDQIRNRPAEKVPQAG